MTSLLYALVTLGYFALAAWAWYGSTATVAVSDRFATSPAAPSAPAFGRGFGALDRTLLLFIWLAHVELLRQDVLGADGLRFGFALALSATMWLAVAVFWIESFFFALASMRLLILPLAGWCAILPFWFPGTVGLVNGAANVHSPAFDAHLVVALAAYGFLTIAAFHALLMAALDRWLHRTEIIGHGHEHWRERVQAAVLGQLPPLLTLERLLFRLVGSGFFLLTLTVLTGVVFSERLFGRPMKFDHKTVFTLIAWLIFAALLVGRVFYGWRGRVALRWTLAGFLAMFLAYAGSRFVLEVILHRV